MSNASAAAVDLLVTVFSIVLPGVTDDGTPPPAHLVGAALWALSHSPHLDALRATPPQRGALAELIELDPTTRALVLSSEAGQTALAADLEDVRPGRDGAALTLRRDLDPEGEP